MDVTQENFWEQLPNLLVIIACSDYIAIDLEMTGIQVRDSYPQGTISMEQVYQRAKEAASTFQAIQLGITSIRWTGTSYQTCTFTVPISPMFSTTTKESRQMAEMIDRRLTFSYSTLLFLREHKFDLAGALGSGVPYLSRKELAVVDEWLARDGSQYEKIDLETLDDDDSKFCESFRKDVNAWLENYPEDGLVLTIYDPRGGPLRRSTTKISFQVIRDEFPRCHCWREYSNWAINIKLRDEDENDKSRNTLEEKKVAVSTQIALTWIVEALMGSHKFTEYQNRGFCLPPASIAPHVLLALDQDPDTWPESATDQWKKTMQLLKARKPIIIGHNILYDLCFIHSMFIDDLPDNVADFRKQTQSLFPHILDIKVLIAPVVDRNVIDPSLGDIFGDLEYQTYPFVCAILGWGFRTTGSFSAKSGAAHNAGFDSYMTALVFLKLACRRLRKQREALKGASQGQCGGSEGSWYLETHELSSPMDKYLPPEEVQLPSFDSEFFACVGNRLRMSSAGVLDLNPSADEGYKGKGDGEH